MKTTLLAAALLVGVATPALAGGLLYNGLTEDETSCLRAKASDGFGTIPHPEAISECQITFERTAAAMDWMMTLYTDRANRAGLVGKAWVDRHCRAEPAIPRNKWVCWDNPGEDAQEERGDCCTREYR